jgi:hypothetical protein
MEVLMQMTHQSVNRKFKTAKFVLIALMFLAALWCTVFTRRSYALETALPPVKESTAYKAYRNQPKTEMAKINYLFSRFAQADLTVIYDGYEYEMQEAMRLAKSYFFKRYKKEPAEYWIKNYCYKTDSGNIIMFKGKDGSMKPARDTILEELALLHKVS